MSGSSYYRTGTLLKSFFGAAQRAGMTSQNFSRVTRDTQFTERLAHLAHRMEDINFGVCSPSNPAADPVFDASGISFDRIALVAGFFAALKGGGFTDRDLNRFILEDDYARKLTVLMNMGAVVDHPPVGVPADMKVFGPWSWQQLCKHPLSDRMMAVANNRSWVRNLPEMCPINPEKRLAETHFLAFLPGGIWQPNTGYQELSLSKIIPITTTLAWPCKPSLGRTDWMFDRSITATPDPGWYLFPYEPITNVRGDGGSDMFDDLNRLVPKGYHVPNAATYLFGWVLFYQRYGYFPSPGITAAADRTAICSDAVTLDTLPSGIPFQLGVHLKRDSGNPEVIAVGPWTDEGSGIAAVRHMTREA